MKEKIELWASLYSWEELSSDQQLLVGNEYGKVPYEDLHKSLSELAELETPSTETRDKILGIPKRNKRKGMIPFFSGVAAALLIGFFIGSYGFPQIIESKEQVGSNDTIVRTKTDTVFLTKTDTLIQEIIKYKTITKKEYIKEQLVVNDCQEIPSNLSADYKVPVPKYEVPLPKKSIPKKGDEFVVLMEEEYSDVLGR